MSMWLELRVYFPEDIVVAEIFSSITIYSFAKMYEENMARQNIGEYMQSAVE